jgi:hypothetical protein
MEEITRNRMIMKITGLTYSLAALVNEYVCPHG